MAKTTWPSVGYAHWNLLRHFWCLLNCYTILWSTQRQRNEHQNAQSERRRNRIIRNLDRIDTINQKVWRSLFNVLQRDTGPHVWVVCVSPAPILYRLILSICIKASKSSSTTTQRECNSNEFNCLTWFRPPIFGIEKWLKGAQWRAFPPNHAPHSLAKLDGIRFLPYSVSNNQQTDWIIQIHFYWSKEPFFLDIWIVGLSPGMPACLPDQVCISRERGDHVKNKISRNKQCINILSMGLFNHCLIIVRLTITVIQTAWFIKND